MIKAQRQEKLMELLAATQVISIAELAQSLSTSMMTIRRDVEELSKRGLVKKVHGGIFSIKNDEPNELPFADRIGSFSEEKRKIGRYAASLIKKGDIVFFDAGTTTMAVAEELPADIEFTAVTCGLMTALTLCTKPGVTVITLGGEIHKDTLSTINWMAIDMLRNLNANIAFISCRAIELPTGTFETLLPLIEMKRAMVSKSERVILLADHSKFLNKALTLSVPFADIGEVITDTQTPPEIEHEITRMGKTVVFV